MFPLPDNSIFLLRRCGQFLFFAWSVAALCGQSAPIALETPHFRIVAAAKDISFAEKIVLSLENTRSALASLNTISWQPTRPVFVYLPPTRREFSRIARQSYEQGLFTSGARFDWITLNPESSFPTEVAAHEYLHAVLHQILPDLPRWLTEGLCEYYATLTYESRRGETSLLVGRPPGHRLATLRRSSPWPRSRLEEIYRDTDAYAWAWAYTHRLAADPRFPVSLTESPFAWPTNFMPPLPGDEFPPRRYPAPPPPSVTARLLDPATAQDLAEDARRTFLAGEVPDSAPEQIFLRALRLFDDGQAAAARPLLEEATRLRPTQSSWWLTLAATYAELREAELAKRAAQRALATAANQTERDAAQAQLARLP